VTTAAVLGVTRPSFLVLTPVCVLLGLASARAAGLSLDWGAAAIALLGAMAAHVSVNALNEYGDFRSGLDLRTRRTPFSGGSGTLVAHPHLAEWARWIGLAALAVCAAAGLYLVYQAGWALLPLGLLGLALVTFYTGPINRNRYLCLVAPGLGFGPLMVMGSALAASGSFSWTAAAASLVPFFLVSNLLLLNQFPDVAADRSVGRDNLPVSAGLAASLRVYGLFWLLTYASLSAAWAAGVLPVAALAALATAPGAWYLYRGVAARVRTSPVPDTPSLVPFLGLNVALTLATPGLLALGLALAG
jgi:1,4-dihydroxy-2-naphthoate octaprenyltransferase